MILSPILRYGSWKSKDASSVDVIVSGIFVILWYSEPPQGNTAALSAYLLQTWWNTQTEMTTKRKGRRGIPYVFWRQFVEVIKLRGNVDIAPAPKSICLGRDRAKGARFRRLFIPAGRTSESGPFSRRGQRRLHNKQLHQIPPAEQCELLSIYLMET